jgi:hypothetical membrane protein
LRLSSLAMTGVLGPTLFTTLVIVQGILQPDYSHVALPISALSAWPSGWMQNLNFFVSGALIAVFTVVVHKAILPTRFGLTGIVLSLAGGAGVVMAGVFPWINVNGVPTETPQHVVAAVLAFTGSSTGLVALSRRMTADPQWRGLSAYVLATGMVMLVLFVLVGFFAIDDGAPLHEWAGLLQRVLVAAWFACLLVMARRVVRVAREGLGALLRSGRSTS